MNEILFADLGLSPEVLRAVEEMGFTAATDIQAQSIPLLLAGRDVIGRSQTGTGKTAAFAIPAIEQIETTGELATAVQVLILCPTRELAMQACQEVEKLAVHKPGVRPVAVYGGAPIERQIVKLKRANMVIGTPGRVMDHIRRRTLKLQNIRTVVLDEADEMLNMGFREDIEEILQYVPEQRQTVLFSATMPPPILELTGRFQNDPQMVQINKKQVTLDSIKQLFFEVPMGRKQDALNLVLRYYAPRSTIVFCNTKRMVDELVEYLNDHGFKAVGLHGDMKQSQRTQVMEQFKKGRSTLLIATDVAARGIDVDDLDAVVNYDLPQQSEYYVHRIGRTGRAGKRGKAFSIVSGRRQVFALKDIARATRSQIEQRPVPTPEEIGEARREKQLKKIEKRLAAPEERTMLPVVEQLVEHGYELSDIAAVALEMLFSKDKRVLPQVVRSGMPGPGRDIKGGDRRPVGRIAIDIGRDAHIAPNFLVGAIAERTGLIGKEIGKIEIFDSRSVVEVPLARLDEVVEQMQGCKIAGRATHTRVYTDRPRKDRPRFDDRRSPRPRSRGSRQGFVPKKK
ncbi:DEAD/DEAH box helicase [Neobittarella massiliensis]|nr:DEAD/DEAH box helicase [Neobittarella massiliensis]